MCSQYNKLFCGYYLKIILYEAVGGSMRKLDMGFLFVVVVIIIII